MKIHEDYTEYISSINGKKYKEKTSFGFDFLSRHKEKCRKLIHSYKWNDEGIEHLMNKYELHTREIKMSGIVKNICSCGYEINPGVHFICDECS